MTMKTHLCLSDYDNVLSELKGSLRTLYSEGFINPMFYYKSKSIYVYGDKVILGIRLFDYNFKEVVSFPIKEDFILSQNTNLDKNQITKINTLLNCYCEVFCYFNKDNMLEFLNKHYNSTAKLRKILVTVEVCDNRIRIICSPKKKSTSVFEQSFVLDRFIKSLRFNLEDCSVKIEGLLFYEVLNSATLDNNIRIELNKEGKFVRFSCSNKGINTKIAILT